MSKKKILSHLRVSVLMALLNGCAVVLGSQDVRDLALVMFAGLCLEVVALYVAWVLTVAKESGPDLVKPEGSRAAMRVEGPLPVELRVRLAEQGWRLHDEDGPVTLWVQS